MSVNLTEQALQVVHRYLSAELERQELAALGYHVGQGPGQTVDQAQATDAAALAWDAVAGAQEALQGALNWPADVARARLAASLQTLIEAHSLAVRSGADDLAYAIQILADATAYALEKIGEGAGAGFRAFWGLSPGGTGAGLVLAGLAGLGMLLAWGPGLITATGGAASGFALAYGRSVGAAGKGVAPVIRELVPFRLAPK